MDRLKKKCFAGSLAAHGAILLVMIFASAFFTSHQQMEAVITPFTMVAISDAPSSSPNPSIEAPAPSGPITPPQPERPDKEAVAVVEPVVRVRKPQRKPEVKPEAKPEEEPSKEEPSKEPVAESDHGTLPKQPDKSKTGSKHPRTKPKPHTPTVDLNRRADRRVQPVETDNGDSQAQKADQERRAALANSFNDAVKTIGTQGSGATEIAMPGIVGPAFANYSHLIFSKYKLRYDQEVLKAGEFATGNLSARVSITITRDGTVVSHKITASSGNRALDKLIRQVLDQVRTVAPFPPETHDTERTFEIIFNLKPSQ